MAIASSALLVTLLKQAEAAHFNHTWCAVPLLGPNDDPQTACETACATSNPADTSNKFTGEHWYTTNCIYHQSEYSTFDCTSGSDEGCASDGKYTKCVDMSYCWRDHGMTATVAGEADSRSGSFHDLVANWEDGADSGMLVNKNGITKYPSCFPGPGAVYNSGIKFKGDSKGQRPCAVETWNWNAAGRSAAPGTMLGLLVAAAGAVLAFGQQQ